MEELDSIVVAVTAIVAAVGTLVARWNETDPNKGFFARLAKVLDLSQVFDSTRKLDD
jgi:hypothetical protein